MVIVFFFQRSAGCLFQPQKDITITRVAFKDRDKINIQWGFIRLDP